MTTLTQSLGVGVNRNSLELIVFAKYYKEGQEGQLQMNRNCRALTTSSF